MNLVGEPISTERYGPYKTRQTFGDEEASVDIVLGGRMGDTFMKGSSALGSRQC
jgi:hypothetical protein